MVRSIIFIVFCTFLFVGCERADTQQTTWQISEEQVNDLLEKHAFMQNEIAELESEIHVKEERIQKLEDLIDSLTVDHNSQSKSAEIVRNQVYMIDHLVKHLPDVSIRQGFIREIVEEDTESYFIIDYAKFVIDSDAPNGFHIENEKEERVKVHVISDVEIFILEGTIPKYTRVEDFTGIVEEYDRFFNLYFIEDKLVLIDQRYIP